jgi:two-component sensor histidine kinase
MSVYLKTLGDLSEENRLVLRRLASNLDLLADLTYADLLLWCRSGEDAVVVAEGRPAPVPSLFAESQLGRRVSRAVTPGVHRVLDGDRARNVQGVLVGGVPTMQEVFAIHGANGEVIAALGSEMAMLEHERLRRRSALYRQAIARVREDFMAGRLDGKGRIGRLSVHDGYMLIDSSGIIQYVSAVAEHLYRRLGVADTLVDTQIAELDTNEYVCFRAIELGECLEQRVTERDFVWIKRVIPLLPREERGLFGRLRQLGRMAEGALIIIEDVTEEVRKEQELRIKSAMIHEIHHRVKNNLQTIAALLRMQARKTGSEEVAEQLRQAISRIQSVAVVHEFLSKDEQAVINIHEVANRIVEEVTHGTLDPDKRISVQLEGTRQFLLPTQQATSCALIINELVQNAVEHGYVDRQEGTIVVRLGETQDSMTVEIVDNGIGLPPDFNLERSGLGLRIVQTLVREDLKGEFRLDQDHGVRAVVSFPKSQPEPASNGRVATGAASRS